MQSDNEKSHKKTAINLYRKHYRLILSIDGFDTGVRAIKHALVSVREILNIVTKPWAISYWKGVKKELEKMAK